MTRPSFLFRPVFYLLVLVLPYQVDGTDVRDMEHGELINLMKAGGDALELVIKPSSGQTVFMERVTGETNAQRLAKASSQSARQ